VFVICRGRHFGSWILGLLVLALPLRPLSTTPCDCQFAASRSQPSVRVPKTTDAGCCCSDRAVHRTNSMTSLAETSACGCYAQPSNGPGACSCGTNCSCLSGRSPIEQAPLSDSRGDRNSTSKDLTLTQSGPPSEFPFVHGGPASGFPESRQAFQSSSSICTLLCRYRL
jgi:hypothetical protein